MVEAGDVVEGLQDPGLDQTRAFGPFRRVPGRVEPALEQSDQQPGDIHIGP